ncbi:MAG: hypothetical protein Q4G68_11860 [Planctomycetia bacterium]|nr:hypothetical protein [Planctomycetia bacterium]
MICRNRTLVALVSVLLLVAGCSDFHKFPLASVEGTVLCDGQPIPFAVVYFVPVQEGESPVIGKSGQGITDKDGKFSISTYRPGDGAVIAKHTIRVAPSSSTDPNCKADLSHTKVLQTVQVTESDNVFRIEVPRRNKRSKLMIPED